MCVCVCVCVGVGVIGGKGMEEKEQGVWGRCERKRRRVCKLESSRCNLSSTGFSL